MQSVLYLLSLVPWNGTAYPKKEEPSASEMPGQSEGLQEHKDNYHID